jgi:hypothetical protein
LKYVKLKPDMITVDTVGPVKSAIVEVALPAAAVDAPFTEAPWLNKHNGKYYLSYASGSPQRTAYLIGDSATGPWTYGGIVADSATNCKTIRQSILDFNGASYFFYHDGSLLDGGDFRRSVGVDRLYYTTDGLMAQVVPTHEPLPGKRIRSFSQQHSYFSKYGTSGGVRLNVSATPFSAARWLPVPGLADPQNTISFESVDAPGNFLRHYQYKLYALPNDGTPEFLADASFNIVPGLADKTWVSFEASNLANNFLRQSSTTLILAPQTAEAAFAADATFRITN